MRQQTRGGKDTGAGEDEQADEVNDTDAGAGNDQVDDTQDDQQVEMARELPATRAGGLAGGATIPVGNAAAGLTMLVGAGYAAIRRR